jgi:hypothetical protein
MHSLGTQKEAGVVEEVTAGWNVAADGNSFSKQAGVRVVRYAAAVQEELLAGLRAAEAKRKEDEAKRKEEEESRKEKKAKVAEEAVVALAPDTAASAAADGAAEAPKPIIIIIQG